MTCNVVHLLFFFWKATTCNDCNARVLSETVQCTLRLLKAAPEEDDASDSDGGSSDASQAGPERVPINGINWNK